MLVLIIVLCLVCASATEDPTTATVVDKRKIYEELRQAQAAINNGTSPYCFNGHSGEEL
jgi:hypothetical protein